MIIEELESLKTVPSNGRGFAQYYMWSDGNPSHEDRTGYFVTFVDDTDYIKICDNADEDAVGVIVSTDTVGFVGGQLEDVAKNSHKYGLVCLIGHALVRRVSSVQTGDYVISNALGMAQTSNLCTTMSVPYFETITITSDTMYKLAHLPQDNTLKVWILKEDGTTGAKVAIGSKAVDKTICIDGTLVEVVVGDTGFNEGDKLFFMYNYESIRNLGYKVTAVSYYAGVHYAQISLVPNGNALARLEEDVNTLLNRVEANEGNVVIAVNRANDAYTLALLGGGEANVEVVNRLYQIDENVERSEDAADRAEGAVSEVNRITQETLGHVEELTQEAKDDVAEAQAELTKTNQTIADMQKTTEPISQWVNADGSVGAEYLLDYIDNDLATKAEVQSVESDVESANTAIIQNAKEIQLTASSVLKYCVGEQSQAYNLTLDEAESILPVGVVYAPTTNHTEEYALSQGYKTQAFRKGFSYIWDGSAWKESTIENVNFSGVYINPSAGNSVSYWCTGSTSLTNGDVTYEANALYEGTQGQWTKVGSLSDSSVSRIASAVRVLANEIAFEVMDGNGKYASLEARVGDAEAAIENITNLTTDETSALAVMKQQVTDNEANISQLTEFTYTTAIDSKKLGTTPASGIYYATAPIWNDTNKKWTFSGSTQSKPGVYNGADYCYAANADNAQTYLHYLCDTDNQWYVVEKGIGKSLTAIQQQADENGASIGLVVTDGKADGSLIIGAINGESTAQIKADRLYFEGQKLDIKVDAANIEGTLTIGKQLPNDLATTGDIPTDISDLNNDLGYQTQSGVTTIIGGTVTADYIKTLNLEVGNQITMGENAKITWANVESKPENLATTDDIPSDEYITTISQNAITSTYIKGLNLEVGDEISMGANARISWSNVDNQPTILGESDVTTITNNTISTTNVTATNLTVKVGNIDGLTVDWLNAQNITAATAKVTNSLTVTNGDYTLLQAGDGVVNIGDFTVGKDNNKSYIYTGKTRYNDSNTGVYLGTDGIGLGYGSFYVEAATGYFKSTTGNIGGWHVTSSSLSNGNVKLYSADQGTNNQTAIGGSEARQDWRIVAGDKFGITKDGSLYASALKLGDGALGSDGIFLSTTDMAGVSGFFDGTSITNWRMTVGSRFGVTSDGALYAKDGNFTGRIDATSGTINNCTIETAKFGDWNFGQVTFNTSASAMKTAYALYSDTLVETIGSTTYRYTTYLTPYGVYTTGTSETSGGMTALYASKSWRQICNLT